MKIAFVITGLGVGGAEKQLVRLLGAIDCKKVDACVVALRGGEAAQEIRTLGIPVQILESNHILAAPAIISRLFAAIRAFQPDLIQGWMYHGNLAASLAHKLMVPKTALVWGIRQSLYDIRREKLLTRQIIRTSAWVSRQPDAIIYNSHTARTQHEAFGFCLTRGRVIDNGFDTTVFHPDSEARKSVRKTLGLPAETPLIGLIARYHPMKGHRTFLDAAMRMAERRTDVHFLLVGREVSPDNQALSQVLRHPVLAGRVHCLGERQDIPQVTAALDIASSSSSWGEGFPNAVGEAMSCCVPVVATNVGDTQRIVGETGVVVPPGDGSALAKALECLIDDSGRRQAMGEAARRRVVALFSLDACVAAYETLYEELWGRLQTEARHK